MNKFWMTDKQIFLFNLYLAVVVLGGSIILIYGTISQSDKTEIIGISTMFIFIPSIIFKAICCKDYGTGYAEDSYHCMNGLISEDTILAGMLIPQNKTIWNELQKESS